MLEGVAIVGDVIVVIIRVGEEGVARSEDITRGEVGRGEHGLLWLFDDEEILVVVGQILSEFIAQIGVRITIANNLDGLCTADTAMVGGDNHLVIGLRQLSEELGDHRVTEPGEGDAAIGTLVVGQFTYHLRLSAGMTEHVDEVEDHHVEVVLLQRFELLEQFIGLFLTVDLMIGESVLTTIALQLRLDEGSLVQVLTFFLVFVNPEVGEHLCNLVGHQTAEDGITRILCGCGQDAAVEALVDIELLAEFLGKHAPLVVTEIVEQHEEHFFAFVEQGENLGLKDIGAQKRALGLIGIPRIPRSS